MCQVTSGRNKNSMVRLLAAAVLAVGLLAPHPTARPSNDDVINLPGPFATPLAEARPRDAPVGGTARCGAARELRFGWIEPAEESPPLTRGAAHACLAVYQLPDVPRPDINLH
jgi:hypothetical protein